MSNAIKTLWARIRGVPILWGDGFHDDYPAFVALSTPGGIIYDRRTGKRYPTDPPTPFTLGGR